METVRQLPPLKPLSQRNTETFRRQSHLLGISQQTLALVSPLRRGLTFSQATPLFKAPFPNLQIKPHDPVRLTSQGVCEQRLWYPTNKKYKDVIVNRLILPTRNMRPRVVPARWRELSLRFCSPNSQAVILSLQTAECYALEVDGYCSCQREYSRARW